ncbi:BREX-3 system P-loop-containing protein BrxF [Enterococcus lactis]|uniref:BREX-3 system P-loop-containing protein BrxF n=1 Tax=Enterococcus lactis TaxID=357441 RepID=UPI00280D9F91|nr:BREX-3 system P-loop-containing protein BrxF [Enterococcus faecium]MDQ8329581.1 BREX-3 system P-loop-containing protein BrxF [Enterococcus faecium]
MDDIWMFISHLKKQYQKLGVVVSSQDKEINMDRVEFVNLNLPLSELLLKKSRRSWYLTASDFIKGIIEQSSEEVVLFDNFELILNPELGVNFMDLLLELSKIKVVLIAWHYDIEGTTLIYAQPGHKEYRRIEMREDQLFFWIGEENAV